MENIKKLIDAAWDDRTLLSIKETKEAIETVIELVDLGTLRVAQQNNGIWVINDWVKKAIIMYFIFITKNFLSVC